MFGKNPLLVKDLPLNTIKAVMECYNNLNEESTVVDVLDEIAKEYIKRVQEKDEITGNKEKFESALHDKYIKLERKLRNDLAEEESAMIKSFNLKEAEKDQEIYELHTEIAYLNQNLKLIKKENAILEQKMDDVDELIAEISEKDARIARLEGEISEKDNKFNLLLNIYENPKVQEVKIVNPTVVEPTVLEPRVIPTVSCNQK